MLKPQSDDFMIDISSVLAAIMIACSTYLILSCRLTQVVLGFGLFSNGVNLILLTSSGSPDEKSTPIVEASAQYPSVDPVPQALILTAIVIGFALIAHFVILSYRLFTLSGEDDINKIFDSE